MKKRFLVIIALVFVQQFQAQYLNEFGFLIGGSNYSGDIGDETYIKPNTFAGSLLYRRNLNSRLSLRGTLSYYTLKDSDRNSSNPVRQERNVSFTNNLTELAVGLEINYLDYDITKYQNPFTPYLFVELAGYHYSQLDADAAANGVKKFNSAFGYAIPLGIGFKSRITRNIGFVAELRARYAMTDDLDYENNTIPEFDFGNTRYNDWYFFTGIGLTYSFGRPPCAVSPRY